MDEDNTIEEYDGDDGDDVLDDENEDFDDENQTDDDGGSDEDNETESNSDNESNKSEIDDDIDGLCEEINLISNFDNEIDDHMKIKDLINNGVKKSRNIMSPYERCRILGLREKQLIDGSLPMVDVSDCLNEKDIALKELENGKIPLIIVRPLPGDIKEYWKVSDLLIIS
jgi:DNA-directed RNA polymerases I, II, and III subunit RPABC2